MDICVVVLKRNRSSRSVNAMEKCIAKRCDQGFEVGWSFCPSCGKDNRPAKFRPPIVGCIHQFRGAESFCVICGAWRHDVRVEMANVRFGRFLSLLGLSFIAASFAIKGTAFSGGGFGYDWLNSWYDDAIALPGNMIVHGNEAPKYALATGFMLVFLGVVGSVGAKSHRQSSASTPIRAQSPSIKAEPMAIPADSSVVPAPLQSDWIEHKVASRNKSEDGKRGLVDRVQSVA